MGKLLNIYFIFLLILSILIMIQDIRKSIIPNYLSISFIILAILYRGFSYEQIELGILGAGIYTLPAILLYGYVSDIFNEDILGFGDVKLLMGIGYFLGYASLQQVHLYYLFTFIFALVVIVMRFFILCNRKREIVFSPFLLSTFLFMMVI